VTGGDSVKRQEKEGGFTDFGREVKKREDVREGGVGSHRSSVSFWGGGVSWELRERSRKGEWDQKNSTQADTAEL